MSGCRAGPMALSLAARVFALAAMALNGGRASAAPPGGTLPGVTPPGVTCHDAPGYRVIQRDRPDSVGADFLIRRTGGTGAGKPCAFAPGPGDLRLPASAKTENAWDFLAITGDRMALDEGTAAQHRALVVVDLPTGTVAGRFDTFETARVTGGTATITVPGRRGTRALCPTLGEALLPGARMVSETAIDLATLAATPTGKTRCVYEE